MKRCPYFFLYLKLIFTCRKTSKNGRRKKYSVTKDREGLGVIERGGWGVMREGGDEREGGGG